MVVKHTESNASVGKEGAHSGTEEATEHIIPSPYSPHAPLTDEVTALARRVFLKYDLLLVLPTVAMFCECKIEYNGRHA